MVFFKERLEQFQRTHHTSNQLLYQQLQDGQNPKILLITCSDSRILPAQLLQAQPGEVFTIRNAGNIIPAMPDEGGESATIEYALTHLDIDYIIICGHTHCGAMTGLLNPKSIEQMPIVQKWLKHGPGKAPFIDSKKEESKECQLQKIIAENVMTQLEHIQSHPGYQSLVKKKKVHLLGWIYDFGTGSVLAYNENSKKFDELVKPQTNLNKIDSNFLLTFISLLTCGISLITAIIAMIYSATSLLVLSGVLMLTGMGMLGTSQKSRHPASEPIPAYEIPSLN